VLIGTASGTKVKSVSRTDYLKVLVLGILGYYLASFLDFTGLNYVSASLERLILFVYPTMVLLISAIFFGKKATQEQKIAVVITYFGVLLAFYKNTSAMGSNMVLGSALIFISALSYAVFLVGSGNLIPKLGTKFFTSLAMIVSSVAALTHFIIVQGFDFFAFPREVYLIAITMAIVCTVIPSFIISEAIKRIGANNVAVVGSFGPISTIIMAAIILGERISVFQAMGTLIVISGVMLLGTNSRKAKGKPVKAT
jgi:drug/metabolite transporter (DMT)-like permease